MSGKCDTQKKRSYPVGRADRWSPSTSTPLSPPRRQGRREYLLCCLMASGGFGCHDISRHRWGGSAGWESCCFGLLEGPSRSLWWLTVSSGCTARGWGATGGGLGVFRVGGAFVQYAQPLASGSRPSWSRSTRADSRRSRRRTMTTGTLRRRRSGGGGGGGPVAEVSGSAARTPDLLLRGLVSTALTSTSLPSKHPTGIVGILRFLSVVKRRCARDVSTMDTSDIPAPLPFGFALASRTISPPKAPARASVSEVMTPTCLRSQETVQT